MWQRRKAVTAARNGKAVMRNSKDIFKPGDQLRGAWGEGTAEGEIAVGKDES